MPYKNAKDKRKSNVRYRAAHPEQHRTRCRESKRKNRAEGVAFLGGVCANPDCEETENLHVDHIRREDKTSHRIWTWSRARRFAELAKCQLLCIYHHVEKTMAENRGEIPRWAFYR